MPTTVTQEIKAVDVRRGDVLQTMAGDVDVLNVAHKVSWTYITMTGHDKPMRVRQDDMLVVTRQVSTDEEKVAQRRMFMVEGLREHLTKLLRDTPLTEVETAVAKFDPNYGELLSSRNLPGILKTQAMYRQGLALRRRIHDVAKRRGVITDGPEHTGAFEDLLRLDNVKVDVWRLDEDVLLDAYAVWYYENTDRSLRVGPQDPTSRSTSVLSNLIEDIERWAVEKILDELRWYVVKEELDARVAAMLEENKRNANR